MFIGEQMRAIRVRHGDSLRQAAGRTGINYSTLQRLEQGEEPRDLPVYLQKFAAGYGIEVSLLTEAETIKGRFEGQIRKLNPTKRLELALLPRHGRLKVILDFIRSQFPSDVEPRRLALASRLSEDELASAMRNWHHRPPDLATVNALINGVSHLTGIGRPWCLTGWFQDERSVLPQLRAALQKADLISRNGAKQVRGSVTDLAFNNLTALMMEGDR